MKLSRLWLCLLTLLTAGPRATAQEPLTLRERFPADYQYHVSTRVELSGTLTVPAEKGKPAPKPLILSGQSAIEYDERVLASSDDRVQKTLRLYRRMDFDRKVGDRAQDSTLRPEVRRLVLIRTKNVEVPYSPDGPLLWGEIDLVRVDVFTPALAGLLPERPVRPGDRWDAGAEAVAELTDMEKVDDGRLECRLDEVTTLAGRRHARVVLTGTVRGVNEDGPSKQSVDGYLFFDLESNHVSYLTFKGVHQLLDKDGKESGRIEGRFVLTRQANVRSADLADSALRGLVLEPNADNTRLLYDNTDLGVRFLYPRRWRVSGVQGRQVTLDDNGGSGVLITLDPLARVPAAAQYLKETREFFQKQKARVLRVDEPRRLQGPPQEMDAFAVEVEMSNQRSQMDYYILKQEKGGATLAARLLPRDIGALRPDIERIARSLTITQTQK